jgi:hypothetical protein
MCNGKEGEIKPSTALGRTRDSAPIGYLGRATLRREQCNGFTQSVRRQWLGKHVPACNTGSCVSVDEC